jgi:hypothetical protein
MSQDSNECVVPTPTVLIIQTFLLFVGLTRFLEWYYQFPKLQDDLRDPDKTGSFLVGSATLCAVSWAAPQFSRRKQKRGGVKSP